MQRAAWIHKWSYFLIVLVWEIIISIFFITHRIFVKRSLSYIEDEFLPAYREACKSRCHRDLLFSDYLCWAGPMCMNRAFLLLGDVSVSALSLQCSSAVPSLATPPRPSGWNNVDACLLNGVIDSGKRLTSFKDELRNCCKCRDLQNWLL